MTASRSLFPALLLLAAAPAAAQQEATVEALAPVLMAEDARRWDEALWRRGLQDTDPLVRKKTALAVGRLGDRRGTALLLEHQLDPDSTVQADIMFALGLLADTAMVEPVIARFSERPGLYREAAEEAVTALAKSRDPRVGAFFSSILRRTRTYTADSTANLVAQVARETWRLGPSGPVMDLVPLLRDPLVEVRQAALYTVSRIRPPAAGNELLLGLRDPISLHRSWAARAMTRSYADTAGLPVDAVTSGLRRLLADEDPAVRINALRALGSFRDSAHTGPVVPLLNDGDVNTRVQAASTLGQTGGAAAVSALRAVLDSRDAWAVKREALISLARADSAAFRQACGSWLEGRDWRDRATAVEAYAQLPAAARPWSLLEREQDPRVLGRALGSWLTPPAPEPALLAAARTHLRHPDAAVRSAAADVIARAGDLGDLAGLAGAWRMAAQDSSADVPLSVLAAIDSIGRRDPSAAPRIEAEFLAVVPVPESYLVRRWAESRWPVAAERWGAAAPITTGRTLEDYRVIARRFVVGNDPSRYPRVFLETEQRAVIELELYGPDAPLTVANFLLLVDRHFFDGNTWHRVVPNFVVQDGDRRGDGTGGSPGVIRDEINRRRYGTHVLGMALSGPDTGTSQWFITHSPQPHLDGTYTVFGRVVAGGGALSRVAQGDRITTIRR